MADQAKGKGIAPKRASNPADLGQSSRPPLPIRTLLEDKEDGEDYSEDSVSAIKNISSTLASLTNSSNAAATGKTSYSPRFDPFSGTMDLDSPPHPPRKEPHLGPAVNSATSNLDPPIDTGSKEGFKDTITSSIVKELSKKAYTIPDDKNPDISNTYSDSDQAVLLMLLRDSLSSSPRAAILWIHIPSKAFKLLVRQYSRPIESKKEDVYNEFHALTFSTYKKGLSAFNAEFNGYLAKLTMAKIDIDPSLILNYLNIEYLIANILEESRNPATEAYRAAYVANSSNSTPNSNSNPSKKGKNKKKGKKKASYNVEGQNYSAKSTEQASFMLGSYNLAIEEEEESDSSSNSRYKKRKDFKGKGLKTSSNKAKYKDNQPRRRPRDPALYNSWLYDTGSTDHISNSKERFTTFTPNTGQLRPINTGNGPVSPAGIGSITLEVLSRKAPPTYTKLVLDNVLYLPNIDINIVSGVRHYDSGGCLIKETLYGGNRRCIAVLDFKKSGFFLDVKGSSKPILHANFAFPLGLSSYTTKSIELQRNKIVVEIPSNSIRKEDYRPIIEDAIVSEAIEPNKRYKLRNSPAKGTTLEGVGPSLRGKRPRRPTREPKPLTGTGDLPCMLRELVIKGNKVEKAISSPTLKEPNIVLKTSTVKFIEDNIVLSQPTNNTALEGELVDLDLDLEGAVSPDPSNLNTKKPISIEIGPSKLEPYESSSDKLIFTPKPIEVIAPNQPITNEPLNNSNLILEEDKMQLDYYKLLAKTSSYILSFVYKARKRVISKDSTPTTYKQVLKLPRDERNLGVFYNAKTYHFIVTYIDNCLFIGPDIGYITDLKKRLNKVYAIEDLGPAAYFSGLSRSLNRPTKSHLNAAKNLFKYLNSTKDYSICFSYNGNTVANLGPKLNNSSNTTTKLSRDFHSKEGPRPLTTTSTTIVDSRNSKGDKATSKSTYGYLYKLAGRPISWKTKRATTIALSTLEAETDGLIEAIHEVQWIIGLFSELYRPIDYLITLYGDNQGSITVANDLALYARTKHTLLKFRYVREQVKAKIVTIIYLNTKCRFSYYIPPILFLPIIYTSSSSSNNNSSSYSSNNNSSSISSTSSNK
ncbi:hypothetical protein P8C59_008030 [Phyllachora maydis]|uniref:Retrovirus-related Pol polyprotein from transposon TNT 1-94-like beta-barrel domain-containing protein n=1 Tax=Phyllachora maydis TaxID=1825666 RepID=A0AAD9I9X3_9PEZI|nr:hypothetical protein P8C59_008030 [Phyllachora maydis]